jgi:hypothetical protein
MMTFRELADKIAALSDQGKDQPALVWPPGQCPAAESVEVLGLENLPVKELRPVMTTGKKPV